MVSRAGSPRYWPIQVRRHARCGDSPIHGTVPYRRLVGGYRLGVPAGGRVESSPDVDARSDLGVETIGWGRSSGMGNTSHSRRPRWILGSILITLAGAVGIVIGLIVGSAVVVGLSGGLAGILLSLLVFGRLLGTE